MVQLNQNPVEQFGPEKLSVGWPWRFFIFTFILLLIVTLGYLGLSFGYSPLLQKQISDVESNLKKISKDITEADKENLIVSYSQQENLKVLIKNRVLVSKVFPFLEKITNPKVYYSGFSFDTKRRQISLDGVAESYSVLSEQLAFYDGDSSIARYNLQDSTLREGVVRFKVDLVMADSLFK